jgi:hypothetical protein
MKRLERVKGIEPSYSAWKSWNLVVCSKTVLTFSVFLALEIVTEFLFVRMAAASPCASFSPLLLTGYLPPVLDDHRSEMKGKRISNC